MRPMFRWLVVLSLFTSPVALRADTGESTRVTGPKFHACTQPSGYPHREKSEYVLDELDLKPGDVVLDVGAGDGWWSEQMAERVGEKGVVHASEVDQKKVDKMKKDLADVPQVKPYLSPKDSTGMSENSCDLAFFSKVYHHLNAGEHVAYLQRLKTVIRPTGRICIIEKYPELTPKNKDHGWTLSLLIQQAEEAGWIPVRCELIRGTYHYMAIFVQQDLFPPPPPRKKGGGRKK